MQPPGGPPQIQLPNIKHLVAIASGKGGVGKSTVSTNLALALHKQGKRVGLMDADIYGPSIPIMLGLHVDAATPDPVEKFGLKVMSMGFVLGPNQAAVLRGPMIHKYLSAFLTQVRWGDLDYLLVDLPPGTGDAQLSLSQTAPLAGAVTVVTPQDVSLTVARRGMEMFRQVRVPLLGVVENMSYFIGEDGKRYELFGKGGGRKLAAEAQVPFLGEIPIDPRVAACGDAGEPIVQKVPDSPVAKAYLALATNLDQELARQPQQRELPGLNL
jgi:ATP-binding protein involved in chromosome partitioning